MIKVNKYGITYKGTYPITKVWIMGLLPFSRALYNIAIILDGLNPITNINENI